MLILNVIRDLIVSLLLSVNFECNSTLLFCHVVVKGVKGASIRSWLVSASVPKTKVSSL